MDLNGRRQNQGLNAALTSAFFLGLAPVFGKLAMVYGLSWAVVVGLRTILAAILLLGIMLVHNRSFLYIYPAGLFGCILAGFLNGIGSILFYNALVRLDVSLGQMVFSLYPLFVTLWLWLDRQPPSSLTIFRLVLAVPALLLLTQAGRNGVDLRGVLMMLGSAALYGLHLPINQRVLYDMPAPTVTLYTLLAMGATVLPLLFLTDISLSVQPAAWGALAGLTLVTFFSRLALFVGVKHIGGSQTALLGLGELLVALLFSHLLLNDRLDILQWSGLFLLAFVLFMGKFEKPELRGAGRGGWLSWLRQPAPGKLA